MLSKNIERLLRLRNPDFSFDKGIPSRVIYEFFINNIIGVLRGQLRMIIRFRCPKFIYLGNGVKFINLKDISFGKFNKIGDYVLLSSLGYGGITLGNNVTIGAFSRVEVSQSLNNLGSYIHIGNNVGISAYSGIGGAGGLTIGDDCIIGQYFSTHPENHIFENKDVPIRFQGVTRKGIRIGCNCWIGAKVTVLDGVIIGDNSVIAAGTVVNRDVPCNSVIGGGNTKLIRKI